MTTLTTIVKDPVPPGILLQDAPVAPPAPGTKLVSTLGWNNLIDLLEGTSVDEIDLTALEALTFNRALVSDGTGHIIVSAVTNAELGFLDGVTSLIQTQIDGKAATVHTHLLADITDVTMTVADLNSLDDGLDSILHFHASDRARANHTGTQLAATISDFDTQVRTSRLDQMAAPTATVSMNNNILSNLLAPVAGTDAANKDYVDGFIQGTVKWKEPVRVASTANVDEVTGGLLTIDGVVTVAGDRVLLKDQTLPAENGIYIVAVGAWTRAIDFDASDEVVNGAMWVSEGTVNGDEAFVCTTDAPVVIGTTALTLVQFSGLGQITAGINLSKIGNTLNFDPAGGVDMLTNNILNLGTLNTHTVSGGTSTFALFSDNLSVFAATTSLQLLGVISDETGSGLLVFNNTPTILTPTIASFVNATHDHQAAAGGGTLLSTAALSDTADLAYLNQTNAFTEICTFQNGELQINNAGDTFQTILGSLVTADRAVNFPDAAGNVVLTGLASQIVIGTEVTGASTALTDTADIAYLNTVNTFIAGFLNTFAHDATNPGLSILPIAGNPTARADGAIWLNVTSQQLFARINGADVDLGAGAGGGEANLIASLGGGTVLTAAVPKSGVTLQTVSIATTAPLTHSTTTDLMTFDINDLVDADISATADIVITKLLEGTANQIIKTNSGGSALEYGLIGDANVAAHTSTKITITAKGQLNSAIVFEDEANTWGAFLQSFAAASMRIPLSATPTMAVDGDFAIDTTVTDFSHGVLKFFDGEEVGVVSMPIAEFITPVNGHVVTYNATTDEFELVAGGGGGSNFTDRIPLVMEVSEGTVAFPDIHALATAGAKISGFVLPDGASASKVNFKCNVPNDLASTPNASIKFIIMTLAAVAGPKDVRLTVSSLAVADTENFDQAFAAETETTVTMPTATETQDIYDQDLATDPVAGDTLLVQLNRDPTDVADDFTGDIIIVGAYLEIDRTTT